MAEAAQQRQRSRQRNGTFIARSDPLENLQFQKKQHQKFGLQIEPNASTVERHLLEKVGAPTLGKIVHAYDAFIAGQRSLYLALHPEAAFQNHMVGNWTFRHFILSLP
jgi:hypothetical protein